MQAVQPQEQPPGDPDPPASPEEHDVESDESEDEPRIKYQRVGLSVSEILRRDSASAMAVCPQFLVLGTHTGAVYLLDLNGQELSSYHAHSATINAISIDKDSRYTATGSDDGMVHIRSVDGSAAPANFAYSRPILGLALDPLYGRSGNGRFACGGRAGELILKEKGWLGTKDVVLQKGEGPIFAVSWHGELIAWANNKGVKLYDASTSQRISHIERPAGSPSPEVYRCILCWEDSVTLTIGWGDSIQVGKVGRTHSTSKGHQRFVEIVQAYQTDLFICGVAVWGRDLLVLGQSSTGDTEPERPEVRLLTRLDDSRFEIDSYDVLSLQGWQLHSASDFLLCHLPDLDQAGKRIRAEPLFYLASPNDIVLGKPRDWDDHVSWLIETDQLEEALARAFEWRDRLQWVSVQHVGKKLLRDLIAKEEFSRAAEYLPRILGERDAELWSDWVFVFAQHRQIDAVVHVIPCGKPRLDVVVYDMVLGYMLQMQQLDDFVSFIRLWRAPPDHKGPLFSPNSLITAVQLQIDSWLASTVSTAHHKLELLRTSLAELYMCARQYVQALHILLTLGKPEVWELITEHGLFGSVQDKVLMLLKFDQAKAIELLVRHTEDVPVALVVQQLQAEPEMLHAYLHQLFMFDESKGADFHELQVALYAKYDQSSLARLIGSSSNYELESALATCQEKGLYAEQVMILERMGKWRQALELLMSEIKDIDAAIALVQRQDERSEDPEATRVLWSELFELCSRSSESTARALELLSDSSLSADPVQMIRSIPQGSVIPDATGKLHRIVMAHKQNGSIQHRFVKLLESEAGKLSGAHHKSQKRGVRVARGASCGYCGQELMQLEPLTRGGSGRRSKQRIQPVVLFFNGNGYHQSCATLPGSPVEARLRGGPRGAATTDQER